MRRILINNNRRIFLISNMYPSKKNVRYGIFVKNFEEAIQSDYQVNRIVLTKKTNKFYKLVGYIILYFKILQLIYKAKTEDIIYVHFPLHVAPVLRMLLFFNKKSILNFHGSDLVFNSKLTILLSSFLIPIIKKSCLVVPSNFYKEKIINEFKVLPSKIFVYPSGGVNKGVFYPKEKPKTNNFVIGYVSNFIEEKGWRLFLEAANYIIENKEIFNLRLIMIGDGPDIEKVKTQIKKLDVKVTILSNLNQEQLSEKYNEFDLFVFPTYIEAESLGLVGIESMACGVPVIASKVGGPMGYVVEGYNGFLFEKKNSKNLVQKILNFYNLSSSEKKIMSDNCKNTALLYDSVEAKKQLITFLKKVK